MKWIEVVITTNQEASDGVSDILLALGANGVELVDPEAFKRVLFDNSHLDYADEGFLEQYGSHVVIKGYYQEDRNIENLKKTIELKLHELKPEIDPAPAAIDIKIRDDIEWKDVWKEYYKPFEIAPGYIVKPTWEDYIPKTGEVIIEMDPGMAFGTGTHETTKMCAELTAAAVVPGDSVMDIGCGTAILAMIAAHRGASKVLAIDIDDAAVKTAKENVLRNHLSQTIEVRESYLSGVVPTPYDVLVINIIADVIISLSSEFPLYLKHNGRLIVSGIIHARVDDVITACEQCGFNLSEHKKQGEWDAMVFQCIGS